MNLFISSFCSYEGGRVEKKGNGTSTCAVAINKAQDSDNGKWQCQISTMDANNNAVASTADVDVTVAGNTQHIYGFTMCDILFKFFLRCNYNNTLLLIHSSSNHCSNQNC